MRRQLAQVRVALLFALTFGMMGAQANHLYAQSPVQTAIPNACVITGVVRDAQQQPVSGARLRVLGTPDSTRSGPDGRYVFTSCGAGRQIEVRRLGFEPDTNSVHDPVGIAESDSAPSRAQSDHDIVLRALAVTLSATVVEARLGGVGLLSSGFFERRERGFGVFLGPEQLVRRFASDVTQLLRGMPGVSVENRPGAQMRLTVRQCGNPTIWMDGVRMRGSYALEVIDPRTIEGIEVYRGFSEMPAQFHDPSGCGAVVFWSKTAAPR